VFRSLIGCFLIGLLAASCAAVDPVDTRFDTVGRSLAKARNELIFLNLVRASHDYPLSFITVANVVPSLTNTTSFGLPSFLLGPTAVFGTAAGSIQSLPSSSPGRDVLFGNNTASNSTAVSTNFNVSTQETAAFYDGFLKPVDLTVISYFIRQGYSRELLFWLFTDSVEVRVGGQSFTTQYDPPKDFGCRKNDPRRRCFNQLILVAVAAGLTVEVKTQQKLAGGGPSGSTDKGSGSKLSTIQIPRFCFSTALQEQARREMPRLFWETIKSHWLDVSFQQFVPKCGSPWNPEQQVNTWQSESFPFNVGSLHFRITPRSAYGVFQFLGTIMKMELFNPPILPEANIPLELLPDEANPPVLYMGTEGADRDLFRVLRVDSKRCFVHTYFYDGDYCVPEDATNTKRIFNLLAQLIAIQTAAADLSITPVVRILQ
jgi:hypothetical protein